VTGITLPEVVTLHASVTLQTEKTTDVTTILRHLLAAHATLLATGDITPSQDDFPHVTHNSNRAPRPILFATLCIRRAKLVALQSGKLMYQFVTSPLRHMNATTDTDDQQK